MRDLTPLPEQYILSARKAPSSVTPTRSQGCRNAEPPGGEKGGGLSTNVKFAVGVTIRSVAIVVGFCISSFFLIRKRRRSRSELASTPVAQAGEGKMMLSGPRGTEHERAGLVGTEGRQCAELHGNLYTPQELDGNMRHQLAPTNM